MQDSITIKMLEPLFDDFGLGTLYRASDNRPLDYQPYEVSKFSLGIIGQQGLQKGSRLVLDCQAGKIELEVDSAVGPAETSGYTRYKLTTHDSRVDIEKIFTQAGCHRKLALSDRKIQSARFEVNPAFKVKARTFGSRDQYTLRAINISKSGMLLESDLRDRVPFIVNTLLEVQLDAPGMLKEGVSCLAKVVRGHTKMVDGQRVQEFGVRFIEFSEHGMEVWKDAITNIEFTRQDLNELGH